MISILLSGCSGKMGQAITRELAGREDCRIAAGIDKNPAPLGDYPVFSSPEEVTVPVDVVIDFSHPSLVGPLLDWAQRTGTPAVICTTGLDAAQQEQLRAAAQKVAVFFSANMSLGINLLAELCKKAAQVLGPGFDIEIVEKHHNRKVDAPSGTALMLADTISAQLETPPQYVYDRHSRRAPRSRNEIGIHAVRGGTIVGEHEVIFAGHDEVITLAHSAASKEVFAVGAINAALFLAEKGPGLYNMADLV